MDGSEIKIDILEELEKRCAYYLPFVEVDSVFEGIKSGQQGLFLITPERYFRNAISQNPNPINNYYVSGIFDLAEAFSPYVDLRFSLYILTAKKPLVIKTAVYRESLYVSEKPKGVQVFPDMSVLLMPETYSNEFFLYIDELERWINDGIKPTDSFYASYNEINTEDYLIKEPFALRYSANSMYIHKRLADEKIKTLSELAEIIEPDKNDIVNEDVSYIWNYREFEYPLSPSYFKTGRAMNLKLQKGDILLCSSGEGYQINYISEELSTDTFCPGLTTVVRAKKGVSADYLFLYLKSDTGRSIIGDKFHGSVIKYLSKEEIEGIPVIAPTRSAKNYRKLFESIYEKQERLDVFSEYYHRQDIDKIEDILNDELYSKALLCRNRLAKEIIETDMQEVHACFEAGAYKATLIMAGSVLEAFLTDWLSELENIDYFSDINDTDDNEQLDLYTIIDRIKEIKAPEWMQEANKAHNIRKKRNLVHANLCIKETEKIDARLCKRVITYLGQIIETRYSNSKSSGKHVRQ